MQRWLNESRTLRRLKKQAKQAIKAQKAVLDRQLRMVGFYFKRLGDPRPPGSPLFSIFGSAIRSASEQQI